MKHIDNALRKRCRQALAALAAAAACSMALAQATIEKVTGAMQAGEDVVRIELSEPLTAIPAGFATQSPARIALDFPGTGSVSGRSEVS